MYFAFSFDKLGENLFDHIPLVRNNKMIKPAFVLYLLSAPTCQLQQKVVSERYIAFIVQLYSKKFNVLQRVAEPALRLL